MSENRRKFSVIINEKLEQDAERRAVVAPPYHTNPLSADSNPLKEKLMRHVNEEGGRKFTVEDLLKW